VSLFRSFTTDSYTFTYIPRTIKWAAKISCSLNC